jgi:hypothetical protein
MSPEGDQVWVLNFQENLKNQGYYLQPGTYRVIFRRGDFKATDFTVVRDFNVTSGSSETIKFY